MANFYARLNLASSIFPFYTQAAGRTIMVPQYDENWDRYNAANTTQDKGVPQVFYMHNCLPIAGGFQSIGYNQRIAGLPGVVNFDDAYTLFNPEGTSFLYVPAAGTNYIFDGSIGSWVSFPFAPGTVETNVVVTTAFVKGQTYIFYANLGCYKYDDVTQTFVSVTLTGIDVTQVLGIHASNGYMIAWTKTTLAWSSVSDPTNFVPSIQTGAGGGSCQDAKGQINFCLSVSDGFLVYCAQNIVGATYTGNLGFPFIIKESTGSGGCDSQKKVAYQGNLGYHIAMTTAGIQQVTVSSTTPTLPEVSDFLTAKIFEDFDETLVQFSSVYLSSQLQLKFSCVASRFFILSYGINIGEYTHAIVYDIALNRYGKFKIPHGCSFTYTNPAPSGLMTYGKLLGTPIDTLGETVYKDFFSFLFVSVLPKENVAFLQADGTILLVDFQLSEDTAKGVFILGKLQLQRANVMVHQWTDVETLTPNNSIKFFLLPTFDGKDFGAAVPGVMNLSAAKMRRFAKRYTASNISLCFIGAFDLTTLVTNFTVGGFR